MLGHLQESLLVILAFDSERAPIVRGAVDIGMWGGHYKIIAIRLYDFLDRFKKPPNDHLPDIMHDKLEGNKNTREAALYDDIVGSMYTASKAINAEYVMTQLETFIKRQSLRSVAIDLAKQLQLDTDDGLEKAEKLFLGARQQSLKLFDPGTRLGDKKRALKFLDMQDVTFLTGIPELDRRGLGPVRKQLSLFIGDTGAGKTWWLIQLAKMALLQRVKVVHITLEMSEAQSAQRYFQALFAMAKRSEALSILKFERDNLRRISGFDQKRVSPQLSMDDPKIKRKLERRIDKWKARGLDDIIIKEFPGGSLNVPKLKAYLDNLEVQDQFVPDILLVDYPDLMQLDTDNFRLELDTLFKELRGIGVERNIAVAAVSQSNRKGSGSKKVGKDNVSEAYSKNAHSDVVVTYSQTIAEKQLGLSRLFVAKGRNDSDKFTIALSQQYGIGAFAIDSNLMVGNYWGLVPKPEEDENG